MSRNKEHRGAAFGGAPNGAAAPLGLCSLFLFIYFLYLNTIMKIYGYSLYIPYIFHIYFLNIFHILSLVCFLLYGVKSRSGPDRSQDFSFNFAFLGSKINC